VFQILIIHHSRRVKTKMGRSEFNFEVLKTF